jgi:hypothetical protein
MSCVTRTYKCFDLPDCLGGPNSQVNLDVTDLSAEEIAVLDGISDRVRRANCERLAPVPVWPLPDGTRLEDGQWVLPESGEIAPKPSVLEDIAANLQPPPAEAHRQLLERPGDFV